MYCLVLLASIAATAAPGSPAAAERTPAPVKARTFVGQITTIAPSLGTIVVTESVAVASRGRPRSPEKVTLKVDQSTRVFRGKKPIAPQDLQPGDLVVARFLPGPPAVALVVRAAEVLPRPTALAAPAPGAPSGTE